MAEKCPGCGKNYRRLAQHLELSGTCPAALEAQGNASQIEDDDGEIDASYQVPAAEEGKKATESSTEGPQPGLTASEVQAMLAEAITSTAKQITEEVNARLQAERQATTEQLNQVGPAVLAYLREEAAKERAEAEKAAAANPPAVQAPGAPNGLGELISLLQAFTKPSAGGLDQVAETLSGIGKLADALDSIRYRPWRDGVDFATQNILQQSRMGIEPDKAAKALQDNPPNWAARPTPSAPEQK